MEISTEYSTSDDERRRRRRRSRNLTFSLIAASVISAFATYGVITRSTSEAGPPLYLVYALVSINLIFLLALGSLIVRRAYGLWQGLRGGATGSHLQMRIVNMFSILAITPTLIVLIFSALFFKYGIQAWFDERVKTGLEESVIVAQAYLEEHKEGIRADAIAMANDLNRELHTATYNPLQFNQQVEAQASLRSLTEAVVFQRNRTIARTRLSFSLSFERLPVEMIERANAGEIVVLTDDEDDKVRALIKLDSLIDTYLLVGRLVDAKVVNHISNARGAVDEYQRLRAQISGLQLQFGIMFIVVSLLLLLVAIWYGMVFAARLMGPITRLVEASEHISAGDFSVRVAASKGKDEIGTLANAFNHMSSQVEAQRAALINANRELEERRRFTEAVLAGVTTGVVALDALRKLRLFNPSADNLLGLSENEGFTLLLPKIAPLLDRVENTPDLVIQDQLNFARAGKNLTLNVKVTVERFGDAIEGFILTLDDITELVSAQRNAAWSDVARRVAHEIKNPLTPITLAAERLRKKYLPQITNDADAFLRYTETISRHVKDIGRMVEEFVSFARMPAPNFREENLAAIIRKSVFSEQTAHPDVDYSVNLPESPLLILCDERQIMQLFTNLFKNAAEAIDATGLGSGSIVISATHENDRIIIKLCDNGTGFPEHLLTSIMEPYVTTRTKGTGLGLAIVKKTMEDHKGNITVSNRQEGGACITLTFISEVAIVANH